MAELAVNIDHVATLREARGGTEPDPVAAALIAELNGAVGIVCHLREDRRHVNDRDLRMLRETVQTKLDLEMCASEELMAIAVDLLPDLVTIVPENREELTTEGGLDVAADIQRYSNLVERMHEKNIEVSFFIDATERQVEAVIRTGADIVELHTGSYANARTREEMLGYLEDISIAAEMATRGKVRATAGHGLNYLNIVPVTSIEYIVEVSIGHALMSRALYSGLAQAVRDMVSLVRGQSPVI